MKGLPLIKVFFLFFTASLIAGSVLFMVRKSHAASFGAIHTSLPDQIGGWIAEPKDQFFDDKTIFDYIDGAGEVYRAYNMRGCLSRRYTTTNGPPIVLDIFDMGSSKDAFGVFTHDQDGEAVDVGQGALYRPGWLSFWKDRFFVSIYAEEETAEAEKTVRDLGKAVASLITTRGPKPRIVLQLPLEGLRPKSVRYLHHHIILNYHFYLSDENILNLGPHTDAALAGYQGGEGRARLLLVSYPDSEQAAKALANLLKHYLPDAEPTGVIMLENGKWSGASTKGKLLAAVFEAESRKLAEDLLKRAMATYSRS